MSRRTCSLRNVARSKPATSECRYWTSAFLPWPPPRRWSILEKAAVSSRTAATSPCPICHCPGGTDAGGFSAMASHHASPGSAREAAEYTAPVRRLLRSASKSVLPRSVSAIKGSVRQSSALFSAGPGTANPASSGVTKRFRRRDSAWHKIRGATPDGFVPPTYMLTWERPMLVNPGNLLSRATRLNALAACARDQRDSCRSAASRSFRLRVMIPPASQTIFDHFDHLRDLDLIPSLP